MANFYDRFRAAASRFGDRPAIEMAGADGLSTVTYAELERLATGFGGWLTSHGVGPGDRVAIFSANDARWIAAYLGILRVGAVAVPLDTSYSAGQVGTVVTDAGARVLFVSDRLDAVGHDGIGALRQLTTTVVRLSLPIEEAVVTPVTPRADSDAAVLLYTSGTTADPKGVVLTHGNLEAERAAALSVVVVTEADAVLGVLPLFHALAQMANLLLPLATGARVVFLETVNSTTLVEALGTRGITIFACVPQFFYLIHQRVMGEVAAQGALGRRAVSLLIRLTVWLRDHVGLNPGPRLFARVHQAFGPRMRVLITGGSRFDPLIARDLYGMGLSLLNGYGLTETSGAATVIRPGDRFTTSVGHPLPGVEIRIAPDAAASESGQSDDGSGEILIRGPIVMREYFGRPEATAEALEDGWLRTGDLGRLDREGRLYVTGRKKEVIVLSSGKNLYPEEIEAHYRQSAFVKELCVLGLTEPGMPSAERLHAVIVPDTEALAARRIVNVGELVRFEIEGLAVQLPAHKRLLSYDISNEPLPRTTTGKLKRPEIERWQRARQTGDARAHGDLNPADQAWTSETTRQPLVEAMTLRLGRAVGPRDNLELDLHLDSMERVELLAMLEERAGTRVAPETRATIFTVAQLVDAVIAAPPASPTANGAPGEGRAEWARLLDHEGRPEIARDLDRPAFWRAAAFYLGLRAAMLLTRLAFKVEITGLAHVPAQGPCILAPNHQAYLDGFLLVGALPLGVIEQLFFVGAAEYFDTPRMRRLARAANIVPVDPDANLVNAMQAAATGLRLRKILILFPEGERSIDGGLKAFRKGAAILASHLEVPVVPVALDGLYDLWPRGRPVQWRLVRPWRRHRLTVRFGAPIRLSGDAYALETDRIRQAVSRLLADEA
jgi:long-chain acyl-CoA synthetase